MKLTQPKFSMFWLLLLFGCATHVTVSSTHRVDLSSQSKVLAVAARNLEDSVHRNRANADEEDAARAVAGFHREAETFARVAGIWRNDMTVNDAYERLIDAYVDMDHQFDELEPDSLTRDAHARVEEEFDRLLRSGGYAGRQYLREAEEKYR